MSPTLDALRTSILRRARAWTPVRIKPLDHEGPEAVAEVVDLVISLQTLVEDYWPTPSGAAADLDPQEIGGIVGVYLIPEAPGQQPCLALRVLAGPKAYLRLWLRPMLRAHPFPPAGVEWGWVLPSGAVCLWTDGELDDSADRRVETP